MFRLLTSDKKNKAVIVITNQQALMSYSAIIFEVIDKYQRIVRYGVIKNCLEN